MQMIRIILFAAILLSAVAVKAQAPLTFGAMNGTQPYFSHFNQVADSGAHKKKWFFTKYAALSTGFMVFNGGSGTFVSAPVGLQLNRQLNNNVYAFAGVSVAPTYFNFNSSFYQPGINKSNSFLNGNRFDVNPSAYVGLMYINNDKSFSISGSIGVSRRSYNGYSPFYNPANADGFRNNKGFY